MAFFGAYQTIPLTNIRPDVDFPFRLRGGLRLGYMLDRLAEVVNVIVPVERPMEAYTIPSPVYIYTTASSTRATSPTYAAEPFLLASNATPSTTAASYTPAETSIFSSVTEMAKEVKLNVNGWIHRARTFGARAVEWMAPSLPKPRPLFEVTLRLLLSCAATIVIGTTLIFLLTVSIVCKRIGADLIHKALMANEEIDSMIAETVRQRNFFREKLEAFDSRMIKSASQFEEKISEKEANLSNAFSSIDLLLDSANRRANYVTDAIIGAASQLERQYLPFPTKEDLVGDQLKLFKDSLKAVEEDLLGQVEAVKSLIPDFKKEYLETISELRKHHLGSWVKTFQSEKARLKKLVDRVREGTKETPSEEAIEELISGLQSEFEGVERQVVATRNDIQKAGKLRDEVVTKIPSLEQRAQDLQAEVRRLEEDMALSRLAVKSARALCDEQTQAIAEESPADRPTDDTRDLPAAPPSSQEAPLSDLDKEILGPDGGDSDGANAPAAPPDTQESPLSDLDKEILGIDGDSDDGGPCVEGDGDGDEDDTSSAQSDSESGIPPELERNLLYESDDSDDEDESVDWAWEDGERREIEWPVRFRSGSPSVSRGRRTRRWFDCTTYRSKYSPTPPRSYGCETR
ncbi:hypothetical protein PRK78_006053 [Emydomyces testavorans]|uniref:Uncharacterized protein n=1 Tax=Emydomyces testavorans TaxID=2070801 RepID=A0AAF0ILB2_9EURO|nr:hypothetical protein PRK78_006053 [Emydomyces testavorans]